MNSYLIGYTPKPSMHVDMCIEGQELLLFGFWEFLLVELD